jgi:outer membrane protein assembly factor BamB
VFYAFDRSNGDVRWSYDTRADGGPANFHGDPLVTEELVVVGSDGVESGYLYAFDRRTGAVRWKVHEGRGVSTDVLRYAQQALAVTHAGEFIAVGLDGGEVRWRIPADAAPPEYRAASAALVDFTAFFTAPDARIYAVDAASGKMLWRRDVGARPTTSVAHIGGSLYLGTEDQRLLRMDAHTGRLQGMVQTEGVPFGTPVTTEDSLLLLTSSGVLSRFDAALEKVLWSQSAATEWSSFRPLVRGDSVLAGEESGELLSFALSDGAPQWTDLFEGAVRGLGGDDHRIYVGTLKGMTYAYLPGAVPAIEPIPHPAAPRSPRCGPLPSGADSVLETRALVAFGEFHGTREGPRVFGSLACVAARNGSSVLVGLELPAENQDILEAVLTAPSSGEASATLLESGFFVRDYQDGRSSRAMAELILMLYTLRQEGADLEVFAFDTGPSQERDRLMASRIGAVRRRHPEALMLLLAGNLHARKSKGSPWDPEFLSMTHHLLEAGHEVFSVLLTHAGGQAWYCNAAGASSCGAKPIDGMDQGPEPAFLLLPTELSETFDAILYLGPVSASPPAAGSRVGHATP